MHYNNMRRKVVRNAGFTLIELLIVIVIISALSVTVFVALNPVKRLIDARDSRRKTDIENILTAIHQYIIDNGNLPPSLSARAQGVDWQLGTGTCATTIVTGGCSTQTTGCIDLTSDLSKYLAKIPIDPLGSPTNTAANTGYAILYSPPSNIISVKACRTGTATNEGTININQSR
jgi:prepilin-type N-terminal cleavage/methylation domain-containing protein